MVCGARASHSVAGVHAALIAAALVATTTSITMATANPRRMCQRCRRSTAGVSSSARNSDSATGMKTSCAKYSTVPTASTESKMTALRRVVSDRGTGVLTAATLGYSPRRRQAQRPLPKQDKRPL